MDFEDYRPEWVVEYYGRPQPDKNIVRAYRRRYGRWYAARFMPKQKPCQWIVFSGTGDLVSVLTLAKCQADAITAPPIPFRVRNVRTNEVIPLDAITN